jgi:DNA-binding transcriptional ArsR family regulator
VASSIDRVKQSIRERLDEIESERDQLMKALEALTGSSASVGARRGRPPGSGSGRSNAGKRAAGRRAPRGQRREQVVAALQERELGPSEIARQIGDVNPTQISGLLRQLASEGVVSKSPSGKWQLAGGTAPQQSAAPAATEAPAPDAQAPAEPVSNTP